MSNIVGDSRRIYSRFYNNMVEPPKLEDPSIVIYEVKLNQEATVTYTYGVDPEIVREDVGVYYLLLVFAGSGTYYIYTAGAGVLHAVNQIILSVIAKLT